MLFSLFLAFISGCILDQSLSTEVPIAEAPTSELLVEALGISPIEVPFGCPTTTSFWIQSIGEQSATIEEISILASIETQVELQDVLPVLPLDLAPEEQIVISLLVETANDQEDTLMINVVSNTEESPQAAAVLLRPLAAKTQTDIFVAAAGRQIDLLLIVDNSCSMVSEQTKLANNAVNIIDGLDTYSSDYHIGVITTDSARLVGTPIAQSDSDPTSALMAQMQVGTTGDGIEKGIGMAIEATSLGGDAAVGSWFLRDDAHLAIVWISDEDDWSAGNLAGWSQHFWDLKTNPSDITGWAIVTDTLQNCPEAFPGWDYMDLAASLGGTWTQICDANWQPTFENLAATAGTTSSYTLSETPFIPSLEVQIDGEISYDWIYILDTNSVSFNPGAIPTIGSIIQITYGIEVCK